MIGAPRTEQLQLVDLYAGSSILSHKIHASQIDVAASFRKPIRAQIFDDVVALTAP